MRLGRRLLRPHLVAWSLVGLTVAVVVASLVLVPRYLDGVADRRLDLALAEGVEAATVVWSSDLDAEFLDAGSVDGIASALGDYPATVDEPLRRALGEPRWIFAFPDVTAAASDGRFVRVRFGSAPVLQASWTVVQGEAPAPWTGDGPVEVALERDVADRLGAVPGSTFAGTEVTAVVTAIVDSDRALPATQGVFARPTSERVNATDDLLTGGAYVDPASVPALAGALARVQLVASFPVEGGSVAAVDESALARAADKASAQGATLPNGYPVTVSTRLSALLHDLQAQQSALETLTALLVSAPWGAAVLVSAVAVATAERRRRSERVLLSARGASRARTAGIAGRQMLLASVPGAAVGWALALVLAPDATPSGFLVALGAAAGVAALAAGVAVLGVEPRTVPPIVRIAAEGTLVALAAAAVALTVTRGLPESSTDPLLAATPLLIALAASVVLARVIGLVLSPGARRAWRGSRIGVSLAISRLARGGARVLSITGVVIAVATLTSAVGLLQVADAGIAEASERTIGADVRACGGAGGALPAGAAASVSLRTLSGIPVTDDGRLRAVTVLAAETDDLRRVQPTIPAPSESGVEAPVILSASAAEVLAGALEVGGRPVASAAVAPDDAVPTADPAWVLVDAAFADALDAPADSVCDLIRVQPGVDIAGFAADLRLDRPDADIVDVASEAARRAALPTASALSHVLVGVSAVAVLAALALAVFDALAAAAERRRTAVVLSTIGVTRARGLVLAESLPLAAAAALLGGGVGWATMVVIAGAGGLGERLGIATAIPAIVMPTTVGVAVAVAAIVVGVSVGVAAIAARRGRRRREGQD
ncbi:hypothetical protein [Microbacterium sp. T32]|nr:hypothetical protein [Microbacterium sp. T32]KZE43176.1 hypothetical protein AVW09_00025 [Microbacterium sp. T32]